MKIAHLSDPHVFDSGSSQKRKRRQAKDLRRQARESVVRGLLGAVRRTRRDELLPRQKVESRQLRIERLRSYLQQLVYGRVGSRFEPENLRRLLRSLHDSAAEHVVVTGDLTVSATPSEYEIFREAFSPLYQQGRLTVIPGNHDTLFLDGSASFLDQLGDWVPEKAFPFRKAVGRHVALIGLNSSVDGNDLDDELQLLLSNANGRVGSSQLTRLADALAWSREENRLPIVLLHHHILPMSLLTSRHPRDLAGEWTGLMTHLEDSLALIELLGAYEDPVVVLHGHKHLSFSAPIRVPDYSNIQIMAVTSALHGGRRIDVVRRRVVGRVRPGYNLYEISQRGLESVDEVEL